MKRLITLLSSLVVLLVGPVSALAQESGPVSLEAVEAALAEATSGYLADPGVGFGNTESPFFTEFTGTEGSFRAIGQGSLATNSPVGDQQPFSAEELSELLLAYRPPTNDYYVNSPYAVINVVEVTELVSTCRAGQYREVALFLTRAGLPVIGENPNAPNDPGLGASEAIALVCRDGVTVTFFGLPENGVPVQYGLPYYIFEYEYEGRFFVAFVTLDPFASYRVVASFAEDIADQEQYGFVRTDDSSYGEPQTIEVAEDEVPAILGSFGSVIDVETNEATDPEQDAPVVVAEEPVTQVDVVEDNPTVQPADDSAQDGETGEEIDAAGAEGAAEEPGGSAAAAIIGGVAAVAAIGAGVAVTRRKKAPTSKGPNLPMLSDREELRQAADREGLPRVGEWQQVPWHMGQDFWNDSEWEETVDGVVEYDVTKRSAFITSRETNILLVRPPQAYYHAMERGDADTRFAYWLRDDGLLIIGGKDDPAAYRYADEPDKPEPYDRKKEGTPMNLDGGPDDAQPIPPA